MTPTILLMTPMIPMLGMIAILARASREIGAGLPAPGASPSG
jgi:hypothetical protein